MASPVFRDVYISLGTSLIKTEELGSHLINIHQGNSNDGGWGSENQEARPRSWFTSKIGSKPRNWIFWMETLDGGMP